MYVYIVPDLINSPPSSRGVEKPPGPSPPHFPGQRKRKGMGMGKGKSLHDITVDRNLSTHLLLQEAKFDQEGLISDAPRFVAAELRKERGGGGGGGVSRTPAI